MISIQAININIILERYLKDNYPNNDILILENNSNLNYKRLSNKLKTLFDENSIQLIDNGYDFFFLFISKLPNSLDLDEEILQFLKSNEVSDYFFTKNKITTKHIHK